MSHVILNPQRAPRKETSPKVKISLMAEHQKFGRKADYTPGHQHSLFPEMQAKSGELSQKPEMEVVGLELGTAELYTLFALQKIFSDADYQGNVFNAQGQIEAATLDGYNHPSGHVGNVPYFRFSRVEFLEAYGVPKRQTARGKLEYGGRESTRAIQTLISLFGREFTVNYTHRYRNGNREEIDLMRVKEKLIEPFGQLWEGLTPAEYEAVRRGESSPKIESKLSHFIVRPSVMLMFVRDYFGLKPTDFHQQIQKAARRVVPEGYTSKYIVLICEFVWLQGLMRRISNQPFIFTRSLENMAYNLRMLPLIKKREWRQITTLISEGLTVAKAMGLIDHYLLPSPPAKDELVEIGFNPDQFPRLSE